MALRIESVCATAMLLSACGEQSDTSLSIEVIGRPDAMVRIDEHAESWASTLFMGLQPGKHRITVTYGEKAIVRDVDLEEGGSEKVRFVATEEDVLDLERARDGWRDRLSQARYGNDTERAAFADDLVASRNESYIEAVLDDIDARHDDWLIPMLTSLLTSSSYKWWGGTVDALWLNFPLQAATITDEVLDSLEQWPAHELAMRASWAGHVTSRTKVVLEADCVKKRGKAWGFYMLSGPSTDAGTIMDLAYACPNLPGARTPLLPGDSILSIDGVRLYGQSVLETFRAKDHFTVRVARGGVELDFELSR